MEHVVDIKIRMRIDPAEQESAERPRDTAERLVTDWLGVPAEDILDTHELVTA